MNSLKLFCLITVDNKSLACSLFLSSQVLTKGVTNENVLCLSFILCFLVITYGIDQKKKVLHIIQ